MNKTKTLVLTLALCAVVLAPNGASAATNDTASRIEALLKQLKTLQEQLQKIRGEVRDVLKEGLKEGMTDDDVREIQELLASDPDLYPFGKATGYYGPMTKEAVKRFQKKAGLPETGIVDRETRDLMEEMFKDRTGGKVPPGWLRAPGIYKKYMDRVHGKKDACVAPFCKKNDDKNDDKDGDDHHGHGHDDDDEEADELEIEVEFEDGDAKVEITYEDGDTEEFTIDNETDENDIIDEIVKQTDLTEEEVRDVIEFEDSDWGKDVRSIDTEIGKTTSTSSIRFKDNERRTIVLSETDRGDIVEMLADELGLSESRVEDVIEWDTDYDTDIEKITVEWSGDDAKIRIEYENGNTTKKTYSNETDHDEIIERLADELEEEEFVIEALIEFEDED